MMVYPHIDPVIVRLGPVAIHWYGVMYLVGFMMAWLLLTQRARLTWTPLTVDQVSDLILFCAFGVIIGGRLGYMLFYALPEWWQQPWMFLHIWDGGMSFHGGLLGVVVAASWFARRVGCRFWQLADFLVPVVPIGLGLGRLGNFINGELWGRVSDVPWAMIFPRGGPLPRHPSQLYEFFLEGVLLFVVLWWLSRRPRQPFFVSACFLVGYGVARCICECFRQPDAQLGFLAGGWLTMGQLLSLPMILVGAMALLWICKGKSAKKPASF